MNKIKCIIVEDEPLAMEVLRDYIGQVPHLELVGEYEDAIYALQSIQRKHVDVIFLDIHLPKLNGLDFIRTLKSVPQIILTTAYHEYAIEGFELAVKDYLLKPIEFERFLKAVNKLDPLPLSTTSSIPPEDKRFRYFRVNRNNVKVNLDEIRYIESLKDYVRIFTPDGSFVTKGQIGTMVEELKLINLLRIHRSYAVALKHISAYSTSEIHVGTVKLPIGRSYKELVAENFSKK